MVQMCPDAGSCSSEPAPHAPARPQERYSVAETAEELDNSTWFETSPTSSWVKNSNIVIAPCPAEAARPPPPPCAPTRYEASPAPCAPAEAPTHWPVWLGCVCRPTHDGRLVARGMSDRRRLLPGRDYPRYPRLPEITCLIVAGSSQAEDPRGPER